jgi:hypothetical protein
MLDAQTPSLYFWCFSMVPLVPRKTIRKINRLCSILRQQQWCRYGDHAAVTPQHGRAPWSLSPHVTAAVTGSGDAELLAHQGFSYLSLLSPLNL